MNSKQVHEWELVRRRNTPARCIGELCVELGQTFCYTLEDTCRDNAATVGKIPGKTAIPDGRYKLVISDSRRFRRLMPELLRVPNFRGVRIHAGNAEADTDGCVLVGQSVLPHGTLMQSRVAYYRLFAELDKLLRAGDDVYITVRNEFPEPLT